MKTAFGRSLDENGNGNGNGNGSTYIQHLVAVLKLAPAGVNFAALTVERVRTKGLGG